MSKLKIGPLSEIHFSMLVQKLQAANVPFERTEDLEVVKKFQEQVRNRGITKYPQYEGGVEYIYLELDKENIFHIMQDLDKLGLSLRKIAPEGLDEEEFICPKCQFTSNSPGICPRDQTNLITYSAWAELVAKKLPRRPLYVLGIFALLIVLGILPNSKFYEIVKFKFIKHVTSIDEKDPSYFYDLAAQDVDRFCKNNKEDFNIYSEYPSLSKSFLFKNLSISDGVDLYLLSNGNYILTYSKNEAPQIAEISTWKTLEDRDIRGTWKKDPNGNLILSSLGRVRGSFFDGQETLILETDAFGNDALYKYRYFFLTKNSRSPPHNFLCSPQ